MNVSVDNLIVVFVSGCVVELKTTIKTNCFCVCGYSETERCKDWFRQCQNWCNLKKKCDRPTKLTTWQVISLRLKMTYWLVLTWLSLVLRLKNDLVGRTDGWIYISRVVRIHETCVKDNVGFLRLQISFLVVIANPWPVECLIVVDGCDYAWFILPSRREKDN